MLSITQNSINLIWLLLEKDENFQNSLTLTKSAYQKDGSDILDQNDSNNLVKLENKSPLLSPHGQNRKESGENYIQNMPLMRETYLQKKNNLNISMNSNSQKLNSNFELSRQNSNNPLSRQRTEKIASDHDLQEQEEEQQQEDTKQNDEGQELQNEYLQMKDQHDLVGFLLTCKKISSVVEDEDQNKLQNNLWKLNNKESEKINKKIKQKKFIKKENTLSEDIVTNSNQAYQSYVNRLMKQSTQKEKQQQLIKQQTMKANEIAVANLLGSFNKPDNIVFEQNPQLKRGITAAVLSPAYLTKDDENKKLIMYKKTDEDEDYVDLLRYQHQVYQHNQLMNKQSKYHDNDCKCTIF
ncbi:UNKNOWN [Stylonychia lemnae]|uniref:Uncharacterized protein n=1 Tax=Stylonychia lemnae TaxID=5949 RepID=A0A078AQC6_STYLE|nr:UNKNOWN [Stylonychia lemnae]|eukprot:CDW83447.1 UNKNOWN [Stylonychia lemnae]